MSNQVPPAGASISWSSVTLIPNHSGEGGETWETVRHEGVVDPGVNCTDGYVGVLLKAENGNRKGICLQIEGTPVYKEKGLKSRSYGEIFFSRIADEIKSLFQKIF